MQMDVFQALSDPTRRRIVESLLAGEQQVGEVVQRAGVHQSGVSRHLRILYESGFVTVRPEGQRRYYSLKAAPFQEVAHWLADFRILWEARLDRFETALAEKTKQSRPTKQNGTKKGKSS
jgi:DNA-binding transcriptional ArsR family regulator